MKHFVKKNPQNAKFDRFKHSIQDFKNYIHRAYMFYQILSVKVS